MRKYFYRCVQNRKITLHYSLPVYRINNGVFLTSHGHFPHTLSGWNGKISGKRILYATTILEQLRNAIEPKMALD